MFSRQVGFSTGAFHKELNTRQALQVLQAAACPAVELGLVRQDRIKDGWLGDIIANDLVGFSYISLHAPADRQYRDDEETRQLIALLNDFHRRHPLDAVVMHPDTVIDWSVMDACEFPVAFENMDARKTSFRTIAEIKELLQRYPQARFVFDINHAHTNGFDLEQTVGEVAELADRLTHIHLSGFQTYHEPIYQTNQAEFIRAIAPLAVPIIIESVLPVSDLALELSYIHQQFALID